MELEAPAYSSKKALRAQYLRLTELRPSLVRGLADVKLLYFLGVAIWLLMFCWLGVEFGDALEWWWYAGLVVSFLLWNYFARLQIKLLMYVLALGAVVKNS